MKKAGKLSRRTVLKLTGAAFGASVLPRCGGQSEVGTSRSAVQVSGPRLYMYHSSGLPSVPKGGTLSFATSSSSTSIRIDLYRFGASGASWVWSSPWASNSPTFSRPDGNCYESWNWPINPAFANIAVQTSWPTGAYVAVLREAGASSAPTFLDPSTLIPQVENGGLPPNQQQPPAAAFVIRPSTPQSAIAYIVPFHTLNAYNASGRSSPSDDVGSLYVGPSPVVTFLRRGGGGLGGDLSFPAPDTSIADSCYDQVTADSGAPPNAIPPTYPTAPSGVEQFPIREGFMHFQYRLIRWVDAAYPSVEYYGDVDIHSGQMNLSAYKLVIFGGHHEYWSVDQRNAVASYIATGGNVAFLGGNTCWWKIDYATDAYGKPTFSCNKANDTNLWWRLNQVNPSMFKPENTLTGVSYRNGGYSGAEPRSGAALGYTVQTFDDFSCDFLYENAEITDGETFGSLSGLIGGEWDGAMWKIDPASGRKVPGGWDQSPTDFRIMGFAENETGWQPREDDLIPKMETSTRAATMGMYTSHPIPPETRRGTVFTASTTDWGRVLARAGSAAASNPNCPYSGGSLPFEPVVEAVTRNVVEKLSANGTTYSRIGDPVAIVAGVNGEIALFARGKNGNVATTWQSGAFWSGWVSLGGITLGIPSVTLSGNGAMAIYSRFAGGSLGTAWQYTAGGGFSTWASLGNPLPGFVGEPCVFRRPSSDTLQAIVVGRDGNLWTSYQPSTGSSWNAWVAISSGTTFVGRPTTTVLANDLVQVFCRDVSGNLWFGAQSTFNGIFAWSTLGAPVVGLVGDPSVVVASNGAMEAFVRGRDSACWTLWQSGPGSGFTGWLSLGGTILGRPMAIATATGPMQIFARGVNDNVVTAAQPTTGAAFGTWMSIAGGAVGRPHVVRKNNNALQLFVKDGQGNISTTYQTTNIGGSAPTASYWGAWTSLGSGV